MFLENQFVRYENLLSYRTRIRHNELHKIIGFVQNHVDAFALKAVGNTIFTISERIESNDDEILGIEILIPVDRQFESEGQCIYKPFFRLENAISTRYIGAISDFNTAEKEMRKFISTNNFKVKTDFYCEGI